MKGVLCCRHFTAVFHYLHRLEVRALLCVQGQGGGRTTFRRHRVVGGQWPIARRQMYYIVT